VVREKVFDEEQGLIEAQAVSHSHHAGERRFDVAGAGGTQGRDDIHAVSKNERASPRSSPADFLAAYLVTGPMPVGVGVGD
jgi:hypothetical protein